MGKITLQDIDQIDNSDVLLQMAVIWNLSLEKDLLIFNEGFNRYSKSDKWVVLASICCHNDCPDKNLNTIVNKGCNKGYEYLLRIISRNKNVSKETLKKIIDNPNLEYRYKIVAKTAYERGIEKANALR